VLDERSGKRCGAGELGAADSPGEMSSSDSTLLRGIE